MKMKIEFIGNINRRKVANYLKEMLEWGIDISIAVAYLKNSGYAKIKDKLTGKQVRFLIGLDFFLTEIEPLEDILKNEYPCKIYKSSLNDDEHSFHPKIYIAKKKDKAKIIIGSSNLTQGGLLTNVEGNIYIEGEISTPIIKEIIEFFEKKWESPSVICLDSNLINIYRESRNRHSMKQKEAVQIISEEREKILKPKPTGIGVIVCMTREHDKNDIYNRLIGVPKRAKKIADKYIKKGTRLFIYYKGIGIQKVVIAKSKPFFDDSVIDEWRNEFPETYPVRVHTYLWGVSEKTLKYGDLRKMGIRHLGTGTLIVPYHLQNSLTPVSESDADKIQSALGL